MGDSHQGFSHELVRVARPSCTLAGLRLGFPPMQIGLVDMLREEYGIEPAGMMGHSAGEIACGYADGCLTREQTVLIAYHRGAFLPHPSHMFAAYCSMASHVQCFLRHTHHPFILRAQATSGHGPTLGLLQKIRSYV